MIEPTVEVIQEGAVRVVEVLVNGPEGLKGDKGDSQPGDPQFIQATAPSVEQLAGATKYAWWDTTGGDLTLWIEDGT